MQTLTDYILPIVSAVICYSAVASLTIYLLLKLDKKLFIKTDDADMMVACILGVLWPVGIIVALTGLLLTDEDNDKNE